MALGAGLLCNSWFYLDELRRITKVDLFYIRYEPLLQKHLVHDAFAFLVMLYWAWLVVFIHRVKRPHVPLMVFLLHVVVVPYLIMGETVVFLHYCRIVPFQVGYPIAIGVFSVWFLFRVVSQGRRGGGLVRKVFG